MIKKMKKTGALAISQIFILIVGIIAVSYAIGGGVGIVSGAAESDCIKEQSWEPVKINEAGLPYFCYGNSTLGFKIYTAISENNLKREIGQRIYKKIGDKWYYGSILITEEIAEGAGVKTFYNLANSAVNKWEELNAEKEVDKEEAKKEEETEGEKKKEEQKVSVAGLPTTLGWGTGSDKEDAWQKLDKPIKVDEGEITEIKKVNGDFFVKIDGKEHKLDKGDIAELKSKGILNDKGNIVQDKIKAPETAPFGLEKSLGDWGFVLGHLIKGAITAAAIWGGLEGVRAILEGIGAPEWLVRASDLAKWAGSAGWLSGELAYGIAKATGAENALGWGLGVGIAVAGIVALIYLVAYMYKDKKTVVFECVPWQSATGGQKCEECNKQGILSCSEYQCKSLGQACELLNKGTDEEKCAWVNKNDVKFPIIEPWEDALISDEYRYNPFDPDFPGDDRGVKIEYIKDNTEPYCIKAFTPLAFGIIIDEPAKCKLDILRKENFDDMNFYFSGGLSLYNHSYALSLPGSSALKSENITIENDGEYEVYVRCEDSNGNSNTANFVFKFCVETGPDTTPPLIVGTTPLNNMPFAYNQPSFDTEVYINEPADCRWSRVDQSYDTMEDDAIHQMDCSGADSLSDMNSQGLFTCKTELTGLKDRQENKFYFRCKDQSENANRESYKFSLTGTQPLVIDWAKPENESVIKDSTEAVKVTLEAKTSAGYKEGKAVCSYSDTGEEDSYIMFFNTDSYQHSQDLWLPEKEDYEYFIRCCDLGNNCDTELINFAVESDSASPIVVRAYHEETYLKLVTNEAARCVYDTKYEDYPCDYSFDDGTPMTTIEDVNHYTDWNTQTTFYIICQDEYGNQPNPDECSKIIRPSKIY